MGVLDKFLDAMKLNDDYDDDEFMEDDYDDDFDSQRPRRKFFEKFQKSDDDDELYDDSQPKNSAKANRTAQKPGEKPVKSASSKITPMRSPKKGQTMEVCVKKPVTMEDTRDIADTLISGCTVVLNLEGVDVDLAQRIIDFVLGACYSLNGQFQKISDFVFIVTPYNVDISGDFQDILSGTISSMNPEL